MSLGATEWVRVNDCKVDEDGSLLIKITGCSQDDVRTGESILPFGIDSRPVKGMMAVLAESEVRGEAAIMGYMNEKNLEAGKGEIRLYSADANQLLKTYLWLKANGTMEIGGAADNMVRYSELETAFNELKADHNDLVSKYNALAEDYNELKALIAAWIPVPNDGGAKLKADLASWVTQSQATDTNSAADITPAKINEIKTL